MSHDEGEQVDVDEEIKEQEIRRSPEVELKAMVDHDHSDRTTQPDGMLHQLCFGLEILLILDLPIFAQNGDHFVCYHGNGGLTEKSSTYFLFSQTLSTVWSK